MKSTTIQKRGGIALIVGAALFAAYATLWPVLLPVGEARQDFSKLVLHPSWIWLAGIAFVGIVLMMFGFAAAYSRIYAGAGVVGLLGFAFIEIAYLLQACKVTWEIFVYPIIAREPAAVALLRDGILYKHPLVGAFSGLATVTIVLGIVLFCIALVRSKDVPKPAGVLIFVGAFAYALGPAISVFAAIAGVFVLAVGCLILGLGLVRERKGDTAS